MRWLTTMMRWLKINLHVNKNILLCLCIALNVVVVVPGNGNTETTKHISTLVRIETLEQGLQKFKADVGRFPTSDEGLNALIENPSSIKKWKGAYFNMPFIPKDHWGSGFIYIYPAKYGNKEYDLYSIGKNKKDDHGNGDDISNWKIEGR